MSVPSDQQTNPNPTQKRLDKWNQNWVRIVLGLIIGLIVTFLPKQLIEYAIGQDIPWPYYIIPGLLLTVIFIARVCNVKELSLTHDWQVLSMIANSKALVLISVALTIVPLALSVSKAVNKQDLLPFELYLYWVSGLSFFAFILVYKATAPTVFKYASYRELLDREGSVSVLRDSLAELQRLAATREAPFSPERELLVPDSDFDAIRTLNIQCTQHQEQIYFLVREYTKYLKPCYRAGLNILLIAPVFFVLTITLSKMYAVGMQAGQSAQCYDGWIKATYWSMLKANPRIITSEKLESTQQCLRDLAAKAKASN
ncbi:hypothetical protein PS865_04600 [Pseudomonas fluorescens]|uniref:hypothetical protein n=1 Tax=Pseudomonas fluorescens TaxID=294 RepID=UPI00123F387F|nr:hypothetical protein [Pseudomonas fluorescens]VVP35806.1 hypothetical protein PS865_04600 [Pseudomonas fluorescens]